MPKPVVAILGRPNVGKSTLFNRLLGGRKAIVHGQPGVTRDRNYGEVAWRGRSYTLVDTGGFEPSAKGGLLAAVRAQAELALQEASLLLFVVDAKEGLMPADEELARIFRQKATKPVFLVVNKVDSSKDEGLVADFFQLGFEEVFAISAEHGLGIGELMDQVAATLPSPEEAEEARAVTIAVIGRPNVGKSSLINRILGEERVIVDEAPGTTRDAVDTLFTYDSKRHLLIDTAGIRAPGRVKDLEHYSILRAIRSVKRADVTLVLLDASEGVTAQDGKIAGIAHEAGCGIVLVVNKWDLVEEEAASQFTLDIKARLKYLDYAPILFVSAKTGLRVMRILDFVDAVKREREKRIPTHELNTLIEAAVARYPPPPYRGREVKIRYVVQARRTPPTFVFFTDGAAGIHFSYERYLVNQLRQAYGFQGTPLRLVFREKKRR